MRIHEIEWLPREGSEGRYCIVCGNKQEQGHAHGCRMAGLADGDRLQEDVPVVQANMDMSEYAGMALRAATPGTWYIGDVEGSRISVRFEPELAVSEEAMNRMLGILEKNGPEVGVMSRSRQFMKDVDEEMLPVIIQEPNKTETRHQAGVADARCSFTEVLEIAGVTNDQLVAEPRHAVIDGEKVWILVALPAV